MRQRQHVTVWTVLCAICFGACTEEKAAVPDAFKDATQAAVTMGIVSSGDSSCEYSRDEGTLAVATVDGELRVAYTGCFACEYFKQAAYVKAVNGGYHIFFQTPETDGQNACGDARYTLRLFAGPGVPGDTVTVFADVDTDGEPIRRATTVATAEPSDCAGLVACDAETPCANEGRTMDERADDYTLGCISLPTCGGAFCIWDAEACMMECGTPTCGIAESYPMQSVCE